jgi:hypothetical protein
MGGLVVEAAVGRGVIDPERIDHVIYVGSPLEGAPSAFGAMYVDGNLPHLREIVWLLQRRRNSALFFSMLMDCVRTFPSLYQLMPPPPHEFLFERDGSAFNPFDPPHDSCIPERFRDDAASAREAVLEGRRRLDEANILRHAIFVDHHHHPTPHSFRVAPRGPSGGFDVLETLTTQFGDGTVCRDSAVTPSASPVANVDHAAMPNDIRVARILKTVL